MKNLNKNKIRSNQKITEHILKGDKIQKTKTRLIDFMSIYQKETTEYILLPHNYFNSIISGF